MSDPDWDLKLSPVFSAAAVFSYTLSPTGHCPLTMMINHRPIASPSSSCSYVYRAIEILPPWCPIITGFAGLRTPRRPWSEEMFPV